MTEAARKLGEQQAYPVVIGTPTAEVNFGLTKREAFAKAAMQAIIQTGTIACEKVGDAAKSLGIEPGQYNRVINYPILIARDAVIQADALLEELAKEQS